MAKGRSKFVCQECGAIYNKWTGKCESCGNWNSISEETTGAGIGGGPASKKIQKGRVVPLVGLTGESTESVRFNTGIAELDRVTGGGFVKGSAILVGGDPGIGKSTLLLQAGAALANKDQRCVYVSGEEAIDQVRLRAKRLGIAKAPVELAAETSVEDIIATLESGPTPEFVILDSIQTLWTELAESAPGTVTQVRASAQLLVRYAKNSGTTVVIVGHVTKDGQIAGPRVVEHMVDAVLYFEGDGNQDYRILRSVKNRFGPTDEIGVFEMTGMGLKEVGNPSTLFLGERNSNSPGSSVFAGIEGTRPILIEFQALVAPSPLGTPRRAVVGWDNTRLSMILAVLETRCGVRFAQHDVYLNVAGGMRIKEPAADLAVAASLVSSISNVAIPTNCVYFGEVSLSGAVRAVAQAAPRLKEAMKLGFTMGICPATNLKDDHITGIETSGIVELNQLVAGIAKGGK